jgi:hypothetical protein
MMKIFSRKKSAVEYSWCRNGSASLFSIISIISKPCQDDGMVVTVSLNLMQGGGGFGLALCEQGGAFQDRAQRPEITIFGSG